MYDKHEQIAHDAEFVVCILGNPETSDFELIDISHAPLPEHLRTPMRERGFRFLGTVGLLEGVPRTALEEPLSPEITSALAQAYIRHVEAAANARLEVAWLQRLHGLKAVRPN
jgi:hypothetical protein